MRNAPQNTEIVSEEGTEGSTDLSPLDEPGVAGQASSRGSDRGL